MRLLLSLCLIAAPGEAQLTPREKQLNLESFEKVWTTIRDKHWQKNPGGLDWNAIHEEFRPKIEKTQSDEEWRATVRQMLARLKQTHFGIFPGIVLDGVDGATGDGATGIDTRILGGDQAVVTGVEPESPAERAGVKPGWIILSVDGKPMA